jgi:hypothetical protein
MMDDAQKVQSLLEPLRERPLTVDAERLAARRGRIVPALRRQLAEELPRRRVLRRARWFMGAGLAAAAVLALWVGFQQLSSHRDATIAFAPPTDGIMMVEGAAFLERHGVTRALVRGEQLPAPAKGELTTAPAASARLRGADGLELELGAATRVSLAALSPHKRRDRVYLSEGQLTCRVPPLDTEEHFSVVTPDARVVVHGTVFTVRVGSAGSDRPTCVQVAEGKVVVHHRNGQSVLEPGASWGCTPETTSAPSAVERDSRTALRPPSRAAAVASGASGTLARETALLQSALAHERAGRSQAAVETLRELLAKHPQSPLLPEARRALERVTQPQTR